MLQANAYLLAVENVPVETYEPTGADTTKWSGQADCYLTQSTKRVTTGGGSELQRTWTVYVPTTLAVDWQVGDLVTIKVRGRAFSPTYTVPIQAVDVRDSPDMPPEVCTVALTVEPAAP